MTWRVWPLRDDGEGDDGGDGDDEQTVTVTETRERECEIERQKVVVEYMDEEEEPLWYDGYEDENGVRIYKRIRSAGLDVSGVGIEGEFPEQFGTENYGAHHAICCRWWGEVETVARVVKANVRRFHETDETNTVTFTDTEEYETEKPIGEAVEELYNEVVG